MGVEIWSLEKIMGGVNGEEICFFLIWWYIFFIISLIIFEILNTSSSVLMESILS